MKAPILQRRTLMSQSDQLSENPTIGFIGLGVMGLPMVANLSQKFHNLVVWNRTDKSAELKTTVNPSTNIEVASTPSEVVANADLTFSMLSTPEAVHAVFYDHDSPALSSVVPGKALIDCSTLQFADMIATSEDVLSRGGTFLEAPVSGSKVPAEQGQLIFLCAGDKPLFDKPATQTALQLMGKKSFFLGEVGNGTKMKVSFTIKNTTLCRCFCHFHQVLSADHIRYVFSLFLLHAIIACCQSTDGHNAGCSG